MTHRLAFLVFASLAAVIASGCLFGHDTGSRVAPKCTAQSGTPATTPVVGCPPALAARWDNATLSDCQAGSFSILFVPKAVFDPSLPPGVVTTYDNRGVPGSATFMIAYSCRQGLFNGTVAQDVEFGAFSVVIHAPPGEKNESVSDFALQWYTNSRVVQENASIHGLQMRLVDHVSVQAAQTPASNYQVQFDLPETAPDYSAKGLVAFDTQLQSKHVVGEFYTDGLKIKHLQLETEGLEFPSERGTTTFGPNSYWAQHSTTPTFEGDPNLIQHATVKLRFYDAA